MAALQLPYDLLNGEIADATQVMANFDAIVGVVGDLTPISVSGSTTLGVTETEQPVIVTTAGITLTLPAAGMDTNCAYVIYDASGGAGAQPIVVAAGLNIFGTPTGTYANARILQNYGVLRVRWLGNVWGLG